MGVRDLPASVRTSHARKTNIPPGRGPGAPRVPQAQARARVFRWETRPPTAFNAMDKACSAAAVHETAFCQAPLCAAYYQGAQWSRLSRSAQSPSAALNGYDGTAPFHHTAYATSYTARSATRQATASYAASYALAPFRQDRAWLCRTEDSHGQIKEIQE